MIKQSFFLAFIFLAATLAPSFAQERTPPPRPDDAAHNLDMRFKQLAFEEAESKASFENQMRQLQLQEKKAEVEQRHPMAMNNQGPRRGCPRMCKFFILYCGMIHLLLAFWVYGDISRRKIGSRLWVLLVLLSGLFGAAVYALVRMGDRIPAGA